MTSRRKTIVFDLDGVLSNWHFHFTSVANALFGTPVIHDLDDVLDWSILKWYPLSEKQYDAVWDRIKATDNFWMSLRPSATHDEFLRIAGLQRSGHHVYFATARTQTCGFPLEVQSANWIKGMMDLSIVSAYHKDSISAASGFDPHVVVSSNKAFFLKSVNADLFLDDKVETIMAAMEISPDTESVLMSRRYNAYAAGMARSVSSVGEFLDMAEG